MTFWNVLVTENTNIRPALGHRGESGGGRGEGGGFLQQQGGAGLTRPCLSFQVVSYAKFLYPTNALVAQKTDSHGPPPQPRTSIPRAMPASRYKPAAAKSAPISTELGTLTRRMGAGQAAMLARPVTPRGSRAISHI